MQQRRLHNGALEVRVTRLANGTDDFLVFVRNVQREVAYGVVFKDDKKAHVGSIPKADGFLKPEAHIRYVKDGDVRYVEVLICEGRNDDIYTVHIKTGRGNVIPVYAQWINGKEHVFTNIGNGVFELLRERETVRVEAGGDMFEQVAVSGRYL